LDIPPVASGLSQVKSVAALDVSVKKVSAWEHGKAVPDEAEMERIRRMK
jgi:DNA-binding transcriptional regulator YiaG